MKETNIVEYSKTKPLFGKCKGLKSFKGSSLVKKINILTISMCLLYSHTEANYSISQLSHSTKEGMWVYLFLYRKYSCNTQIGVRAN